MSWEADHNCLQELMGLHGKHIQLNWATKCCAINIALWLKKSTTNNPHRLQTTQHTYTLSCQTYEVRCCANLELLFLCLVPNRYLFDKQVSVWNQHTKQYNVSVSDAKERELTGSSTGDFVGRPRLPETKGNLIQNKNVLCNWNYVQ